MPYKDLVKCWHEGVLAADDKDLQLALKCFTDIDDSPSKIWFNIGSIHVLRGDLESAVQALSQCVAKDQCLAVGYFQRSYVNFKLERYEKALSDCHLALAQLRGNSLIDYKQLGLRHLLYAWEVVYNTAVILCYLGRWQKALEKLDEGLRCFPDESSRLRLEVAVNQIQKQVLLQPIHVPEGELFRPRKQEVEQLKSKDFLGKPKIISSVVPNDQYSGFEPLRPQKPGFYEPCPEATQGREAGYHRVLAHYYPENSEEVVVKANSVLYVLNKDGDWATAIHDGQKILIPTNFLEAVNTPKADMKKINNGIPMPPMKVPPTRPNVKPTGNLFPAQDVPPRPIETNREEPLLKTDEEPMAEATVPRSDSQVVMGEDPRAEEMNCRPNPHLIKQAVVPGAPGRLYPKVETVVALQRSPQAYPETTMEGLSRKAVIKTNPADSAASACPPASDSRTDCAMQVIPDQEVDTAPSPGDGDTITLQVHTEFTVDLSVRTDITYLQLQNLLKQKLKQKREEMDIHLSYREIEGKQLTPVKEDRDLQRMWEQAKHKGLMLCCKDAYHCVGRPILYRMRAVYMYPADGPEDLTFNQGDTIEILSEVNEEWLEGHCNGNIGIFPRCFATHLDEREAPGT